MRPRKKKGQRVAVSQRVLSVLLCGSTASAQGRDERVRCDARLARRRQGRVASLSTSIAFHISRLVLNRIRRLRCTCLPHILHIAWEWTQAQDSGSITAGRQSILAYSEGYPLLLVVDHGQKLVSHTVARLQTHRLHRLLESLSLASTLHPLWDWSQASASRPPVCSTRGERGRLSSPLSPASLLTAPALRLLCVAPRRLSSCRRTSLL